MSCACLHALLMSGSTHSTCPGFWDVRPTRADRSTATKLRVLTPLKDGSAVYLRYPWDRSEKPLPKFQVLRPLHFPLPTVPHRPTGGTIAIRPTFRITSPLRDRPDGTPRARDRFPPRGNTLGRLSLAQGRLVRPHTRTRTCPRQRPTRRPRARGTARPGTARARAHTTPTGSLRPARWPSIELRRLRCRLPLLTASACRARAQHMLQPTRTM